MTALEDELRIYAQREEELKKSAPGKFVVIKHSDIIGTFDTLDDALTEATRRFGLEPYLVRQIGVQVENLQIPALTLGLISAHH
jgi:hypothetical protein